MVNNLPKEIGYSKADYLELLMEHSEKGLTPTDVSEIYFDDVTIHAANNSLRRLKKNRDATRKLDGTEFRYWITDHGILKYDHLKSQEE